MGKALSDSSDSGSTDSSIKKMKVSWKFIKNFIDKTLDINVYLCLSNKKTAFKQRLEFKQYYLSINSCYVVSELYLDKITHCLILKAKQ